VKTERLSINPLTHDQLKEYCDSRMGSIVSDEDAEFVLVNHLEPMLKAKPEDKIFYTFWLAKKEDSEIVGEIGFRGKVNELGEIEIGYFVYEQERNKGYATEMVKAITEWGLQREGIKYVVAGVEKDNEASKKVLLKNWFIYWGLKNGQRVFYKTAHKEL
jgi:RimJ/RimL family protein N-acetyltransferase